MPELRRDPVSGRWVIISIERGKRPSDFPMRFHTKRGGFCAFCEGNEYTTPPEIYAVRPDGSKPNTPGWTLRVVPNKFPALTIEGELKKTGEGIYDKMNGVGVHEVVIETPNHNLTLSTMPLERVEDVLMAFYQRISELKNDERLKYVLVFKNEGESAGASLEHSHSQIIGLPVIPRIVEEEIENSRRYFDYKERCIFCDIIHQELTTRTRFISDNDDFVSIAPFAPRSPFETFILPKRHGSSFTPNNGFRLLGEILQKTLKQIDKVLEQPPYNMMIHTAPLRNQVDEYYHWHIEIKPVLTQMAGFEWGTGFYINPTPPEDAARFMREAG
ncbi:MAG: galactose-1-phosphate uridylyltransferase [Thermodesulfovibrionia bacterium]